MRQLNLPRLLGYDDSVLDQLPEAHRAQLTRVCEAWLLSCTLLASPLGYVAWLLSHSLVLALVLGAATFLLVLNMLRLIAAGAGAAPHFSRAQLQTYRPALGPTVLVGLLALLFAQPAQLPLWSGTLAAPIAAHRAELVRDQLRSLATLQRPDAAEAARAYQTQIAECEFIVLRFGEIWKHPGRAARLTLVYFLLVLLPALGARMFALDALRAYELTRWQANRRRIVRAAHLATREVQQLLSRFPTYQPGAPNFADPPFDTRVLNPLLQVQPAPPRRWFARFARKGKA